MEIELSGVKVTLPSPQILLATKSASLPNRNTNDKIRKDLSDFYAVMWCSGVRQDELKARLFEHVPADAVRRTFREIGDSDYAGAAAIHRIGPAEMRRTILSFIGD